MEFDRQKFASLVPGLSLGRLFFTSHRAVNVAEEMILSFLSRVMNQSKALRALILGSVP